MKTPTVTKLAEDVLLAIMQDEDVVERLPRRITVKITKWYEAKQKANKGTV